MTLYVPAESHYRYDRLPSWFLTFDYPTALRPFMYAEPSDADDANSGQVCSRTGYWAPGRLIVYVDGRPYIDGFQPTKSELDDDLLI